MKLMTIPQSQQYQPIGKPLMDNPPISPTPSSQDASPLWFGEVDQIHFSGKSRKTALESRDFLKVPAYPEYMNELGHVKAGHVLKLIDIAGSLPAKKHLGPTHVVVTASVDRTNFINPIQRWEIITLESRLSKVWKSSLETQVKVSAWNFLTGKTRPIATAYLVMVALDKDRKKIQAPELIPASYEDAQLAEAAELRKKNRQAEFRETPEIPIDEKTDEPVILERVMTSNESNALNNVFGGVILDFIDEAASQAAKRQALGGAVVGVRMDRMSFLEPSFIGETLRAKAVVTKTWNTSMEVKVEVDSINPHTKQTRHVAHCFLVYVSQGPDGNPVTAPPWLPKTEAQKKRAEAADKRRSIRREEEAETQREKPSTASWTKRLKWKLSSWFFAPKKS
jgi:acyl-CoA hydrolase